MRTPVDAAVTPSKNDPRLEREGSQSLEGGQFVAHNVVESSRLAMVRKSHHHSWEIAHRLTDSESPYSVQSAYHC